MMVAIVFSFVLSPGRLRGSPIQYAFSPGRPRGSPVQYAFSPGRPPGSPIQYAPDYLIHVDFASVALQFGAYGLQEAACARAIEDAMVEREAQVHHVTYGDGIVLDDDRAFDDCIHAQYASMWLVDNRHRDNCT